MRARDLGIVIGRGRPGPANAITDVAGVRVGHATIVRGEGPLVVGTGPVRTGVTMIVPHDGDVWTEPVYAGSHRLNGNGELTGLEWIREAGHLTGPIGITNTHSVGVLVQTNYGRRDWLRIDGVPVGEAIPVEDVPSPYSAVVDDDSPPTQAPPGSGSIIVIVATDAPLLPHQCERLAQRAGLGIARMGGTGAHSSGDLFLCFATGNRTLPRTSFRVDPRVTVDIRVLNDFAIGALFDATIEATEEAIVNALVGAATMTGRDGITAHALPHERLLETMARFGRPAGIVE